MTLAHREPQPAGAIIDVASWPADDDYPVFPVGSKPKRLVVCPDTTTEGYLIRGHRYLFKVAAGWQAQQVWSEIIAYEIARTIDVPVPPAFLAVDSNTGEVGVLVEFFYGYPGDQHPPRLVHAIDVLQRLYSTEAYNKKVGRPHHIRQNLAICRVASLKSAEIWWGRALAFDAIIGNTDRHPENWGFMIRKLPNQGAIIEMSPIFDNGTSLGYEQPDAKLASRDARFIDRYIARGTHHCSAVPDANVGAQHFDLCLDLVKMRPAALSSIKQVLTLSMNRVYEVLNWASSFESPLIFSCERSQFVAKIVQERTDRLARALGSMT